MHFLLEYLVVGQLDQVDDRGSHESVDVASKIENLEDQFDSLRTRIMCELSAKPDMTVQIVLDKLTGLPLSLRKEYESFIAKQISNMSSETQINKLFIVHLNPLSSFIDYGLIEYVIKKFGSDGLKKDMRSYCSEIILFMKETTIKQLIDHLPGQAEVPPKFSLIEAKIGENASECTLEQVNTIRKRYCSELRLSEIIFHLLAIIESNSFIIRWLVPSALVSDIIVKADRYIDQSFYQEYKITSLTLDGMWLHMSESEIDVMWSQMHVSDIKFKNQFCTMCKQIVCEMKVRSVSKRQLLLYFQSNLSEENLSSYYLQPLNYQELISDLFSVALLREEFPASFVDFRVLKAVIERFGSHCLKRVMESYCNYMSIFTKKSTAQQLINIGIISTFQFTDFKGFKITRCKIMEEPSNYRLETLLSFRTRFCTTANFSEVCLIMNDINTETKGLFTVSWLVSPTVNTDSIMKSVRNVDQSFYQEFKITSLTLDGMWLHISEAELKVMWIHMNDAKLVDHFHNMHKQIVLELEVQNTPIDELSQCLMKQHPHLQKDASIFLSEVILTFPFPPSGFFLDFDMLSIIIKEFGSNCLRDMMMSYSKNMSGFIKQLTVQQLVDLLPVPTIHHEGFIEAEYGIMEEPSVYTCEKILSIKNSICAEIDLSRFVLTMSHVRKSLSDSFYVGWLIPTHFVPDLIESANRINHTLYLSKNIASLSFGNQWVYNPKLNPFGSKLKEKYQQSQGSPFLVEWIPSPTKKIFRLAMIQRERVQRGHIEDSFVRMTISGRVDDILHAKSPIELEHIFRYTLHGGEIILIEGAPGSGKSTLTVHICQRWGKGELFQQFTVVILVQLRDPAVQIAQTIADLLPVENAEEIAAELIATSGRGVLWVLDGWDELPPHLQQHSIFRKLLPPKVSEQKLGEIQEDPLYAEYVEKKYSDMKLWEVYLQNNPQHNRLLTECSVIVTSRPISSGDLHPVVSSRIEVLGFTPEEQRQYFTECLKGDTKALEALLEKIQENPVVQSICYLPLNAAFIVHTFKYRDQSLPNTEYEIYLSVILSCIQRHYDREGRGHDLPKELASLDDLSRSEAVRKPFQCLCELAYRGVMENKVTFSSSDLPQGSNTLSLLQAIESFLQSGKSVFYNFLHLSVQEVLSAYYITTKLSDSEQMSQFQQLFNQSRFAAVFQFHAAITKLKSPRIRQVIARTVEAKSKPLLVSLLRCLHEAQDPDLCLYVAGRLGYKLDLSETSLSPLDCLSISYFLFSLNAKEISVNLSQCQIGDLGAKCLTKYLSMSSYTDLITINLNGNDIHDEGVSNVAKMLFFIERLHLDISENPIRVTGTFYLFQAVRESAILKILILIGGTIIGDLLPFEAAQEIATEVQVMNERRILWILDDLQPHLHTVFLSPKHNSNIEYSIIVTSCYIIDKIVKDKSKPFLVSLLHCLHEVQDSALCLYVAERLEHRLDLSETSLSPLDCLSVSFFLSSVADKEINANLAQCQIGDVGAKCLTKYLHADDHSNYVSKLAIDLTVNGIREEGALHIARILYFIKHLYLSNNPIGDTGASLIFEAARESATLKTLILRECLITSTGAEDLSRVLAQSSSLEKLDVCCNYHMGDEGISHVAEALKQNKQLKELWISKCGMTDKGAASLASALAVNNSLKMLHTVGAEAALTRNGLSTIAHSLANNSVFMKLAIRYDFGSTTADYLSQKVNEIRKGNGLPPIEIEGEYTVCRVLQCSMYTLLM